MLWFGNNHRVNQFLFSGATDHDAYWWFWMLLDTFVEAFVSTSYYYFCCPCALCSSLNNSWTCLFRYQPQILKKLFDLARTHWCSWTRNISLCEVISSFKILDKDKPRQVISPLLHNSPSLLLKIWTTVCMSTPQSAKTVKVSAGHFSFWTAKSVGWPGSPLCWLWILLRMVVLLILYFLPALAWVILPTITSVTILQGLHRYNLYNFGHLVFFYKF